MTPQEQLAELKRRGEFYQGKKQCKIEDPTCESCQ